MPFFGLPSALLRKMPARTSVAVVGAGSSFGTRNDGAENGPYFIRSISAAYTWTARQPAVLDLQRGAVALDDVVDLGDLEFDGRNVDDALADVARVIRGLPTSVVPAVIGGDHTITLPIVSSLAARRNRPFSVVQFDHHLDLQVWGDAPPTDGREPIFHTNVMSHVSDLVGEGRLVQVGVNPYAVVEAANAGAMSDYLRAVGTQIPVFSSALTQADTLRSAIGDSDVYVTVDVDVLSNTEMSSTGYPAGFGLSLQALLGLLDTLLATNRMVGFDVVEFAADRRARDPKTLSDAARAAQIFLHLLGWASRQAHAVAQADDAPARA